VVQEILRHTKLQTTADIYASVTEKLKRRSSDKIGEILFRKKKPSDRSGRTPPNSHCRKIVVKGGIGNHLPTPEPLIFLVDARGIEPPTS